MIGGINTWDSVLPYSAGIVDWTVEELVSMDKRTRKNLAMNGCMHTRSNIARLYLPRKAGGRVLIRNVAFNNFDIGKTFNLLYICNAGKHE